MLISILILLAFTVRFAYFVGGIRGVDAFAYALSAHDIMTGQYDVNSITTFYGFRYILLLPTALSYMLFGVNDISSSLFPFLCSLLNIAALFLIGEKIFNWKVALIGSVLLIFYPLDIISASLLGPDSCIPLFSSLAVLCYLTAEEKRTPDRSAKRALLYIAAGLFIALAISARLTSIFLYGVLILNQIRKPRWRSSLLWISVGLVIPLFVESIYYYLSTGDPIFSIHRVASLEVTVKGDAPHAIVSLWFYPLAMLGFDITGLASFGFIWWLTMAGLLLAWFKKEGKLLFPALWLVLPFCGFEFGTQSLKELIPIMKNYNYLSLTTTPAMLISAYFLEKITSSFFRTNDKKKLSLLILILFSISCVNLYGAYRLYLIYANDAAPYVAVAHVLKQSPRHTIYIHHDRWSLFLKYFLKYDPSFAFRTMDDLTHNELENISNAYVVLHKRHLEADTPGRALSQLPFYAHYMDKPPHKWERLLSFEGKPKYNNVVLYYIP